MKKQRAFTLLEVLLAAFLSAILLGAVTQLYYLLEAHAQMAKKVRKELFSEQYLQFRLASLFASAENKKIQGQTVFFSSRGGGTKSVGDSLVFIPDRGVDLYPEFSNQVLARLYLSTDKRLVLAYWPLPERWKGHGVPPFQLEVLAENVDSLHFSFFSPPTENTEKVEIDQVREGGSDMPPPSGKWVPFWEKTYNQVPAMVQLTIEQGGKKKVLGAHIPTAATKIVYREVGLIL